MAFIWIVMSLFPLPTKVSWWRSAAAVGMRIVWMPIHVCEKGAVGIILGWMLLSGSSMLWHGWWQCDKSSFSIQSPDWAGLSNDHCLPGHGINWSGCQARPTQQGEEGLTDNLLTGDRHEWCANFSKIRPSCKSQFSSHIGWDNPCEAAWLHCINKRTVNKLLFQFSWRSFMDFAHLRICIEDLQICRFAGLQAYRFVGCGDLVLWPSCLRHFKAQSTLAHNWKTRHDCSWFQSKTLKWDCLLSSQPVQDSEQVQGSQGLAWLVGGTKGGTRISWLQSFRRLRFHQCALFQTLEVWNELSGLLNGAKKETRKEKEANDNVWD